MRLSDNKGGGTAARYALAAAVIAMAALTAIVGSSNGAPRHQAAQEHFVRG
jgi:hypothetical protein